MDSTRISPFRLGWAGLMALLALVVVGVALAWATGSNPVGERQRRDPLAETPGAPGTLSGAVYYSGAVTGTHVVWVGVFTPVQSGPPAYSVQQSGPGPYTMTNVPAGAYDIRAGLDVSDTDGPPNPAVDPMGAYAHNPVTVTAGGLITGVDITLLDPMTGTGSITGWVAYTGAITGAHNIVVFANRWGEQGPPAHFTVILGAGPYTLSHVADYTYTVGAFMDRDSDMGQREPDEPMGWYDPNGDQNPDPVIVSGGSLVTDINITLRDPYYVYLPVVLRQ